MTAHEELQALRAHVHQLRRDLDDAVSRIKGLCRMTNELREERNAFRAEADVLRRDKATLVGACKAAEERLYELVPGNAYGLLDHAADAERAETLAVVRAALRAVNADDDAGQRAIEAMNAAGPEVMP